MTPNKEDYLKCIYEIGTEVKKISNKEIASRMQVSPPAVTEMIKRMISEGLLVKDKFRGYLLTDLGSQLVSDLYRKHRLIEVFLLENLDYTTEEVHEEAEVLEHTVSEHFIDKLDHMLGNPKTCPHGGTIPPKGQLLIEAYQDRLSDVSEPGTYRLRRVQDSFELLNFLDQIQLTIGDDILFKGYDDYTGLYQLQIKDQDIQINHLIAQQLYIEKHALWLRACQIEEIVFLETFLRWVRTSANFYEVPWLSFEPKVSKLPNAWNNNVSSIFLTAESFGFTLTIQSNIRIFWKIIQLS